MSTTNTVRLHRVLAAKPEKIYRAFTEPDAMARWLPPNGFTGKVHEMDFRVGGAYRMSFTNFTTGTVVGSAVNIASSFRTNGCAIQMSSMIRTSQARSWSR